MDALMTIGHFSRTVRLSAKALRFYHQNGVLTPAVVDDHSGYRLYAPEQIADAQVVRTLRGLGLPITSVRDVLAAETIEARSALIAEHLDHMEKQLDETRSAVRTLRTILAPPTGEWEITHRSVPETQVVAVREEIALRELGGWFRRSIDELKRIESLAAPGTTGAFGGVWSNDLFEEERGTATVYLTVRGDFDESLVGGRVTRLDLPAAELAVTTHVGSDVAIAGAYAALGEYVARHELAIDAPVRETYLSGFPGTDPHLVTEIGWPVFRVSN